ncbi:MAG TPA: ribose-phosphate pyrophosphokinase [Longimicrobiales bacterium]
MKPFTLLAGTASRHLAKAIAAEVGVPLGAALVERFPDGETAVRIDAPVRDRDVFVIQATSPPVNDRLIELLAFVDACRRAAAARIIAVVPYFGYARSDRRSGRCEPIMAGLTAELIQAAGVDHVVAVDAHTAQFEGFFRIPCDVLSAVPALAEAIGDEISMDAVVVAPDLGAADRAAELAERFGTSYAVLDKRRTSGTTVEVARVFGDVRGRPCVVVDDMISTGGTIAEAVRALRDAGARPEVTVVATHAVLSGPARERLLALELRALVLTDTIPVATDAWPKARIVSVAPLIAAAIRRLAEGAAPRVPEYEGPRRASTRSGERRSA